ncbi:MAG: tetratricopeptide repeat protein [Leptolyngbyaceae bacterium]|nr:tetratricopeptide repeat protein [Leptolyngbyaceae bacterium]
MRQSLGVVISTLLWCLPVQVISIEAAQSQSVPDRKTEADRLLELGKQQYAKSQYREVVQSWQSALEIYRAIPDRNGEGASLNNLGAAYDSLGQYTKAIEFHQQPLALRKQIGDRSGEGGSLSNLDFLFEKQKQPELAILFYKQSVNVHEAIRQDLRKLSPAEQKSYLSTVEQTYRNLADLLLQQDRILEAQQVLDLLKVEELGEYFRTVRGNSQIAKGTDLQRPEQNKILLPWVTS